MKNYLLPIYHSNLKPWIKWWLLKQLELRSKTLSDWIEGTTPITITGAFKEKIQNLELEGNTSQVQREGYNLLNENTLRQGGYQGSTGSRVFFDANYYLEAGTYTFISNLNTTNFKFAVDVATREFPLGAGQSIDIYDSLWQTTIPFTFTITQSGYLGVGISKPDNSSITPSDISEFKFMIYEGSYDSSISYEPYGYHPSPTNPSEIQVVKGHNVIKINTTEYPLDLKSKNLFDKNTVTNGYYLNESGGLTANGNYCVSEYIQITEGETYYIPTRGTSRTKFYTSTKTAYSNTWDVTDGSKNFTVPSGVSYIRISISISGSTAVSLDTFMFNLGETALPYESYFDYELCKIRDDYSDYILPDTNGYKILRLIGKVVFNGTEDITTNPNGTNSFYLPLTNTYKNANVSTIFSNYFKGISYSDRVIGGDNTIYTEINNNNATVRNTSFTSLSDFKTWLSTHNTFVYYILANSTTETITNTNLISQLDAIYNAQFKDGTNTITQTNLSLPFILHFKYYKKG